jgi:hypothetical protein
VLAPVVTLRVLLPAPPLIEVGLNAAVAPEGSPLALRLTVPLKPPDAATVTA